VRANFIGVTFVAGVKKNRWECPNCRKMNGAECRFNLSLKKTGGYHNCRFCGIVLELII